MGYKGLKVWKKAYEVSLEIHVLSQRFPKQEQYELGSQIRRASKGIALNVAEGYSKNSSSEEFKRFLTMALGSSEEVQVILEYCKDLGYMDEVVYEKYAKEYDEISRMLYVLHKNWQDLR